MKRLHFLITTCAIALCVSIGYSAPDVTEKVKTATVVDQVEGAIEFQAIESIALVLPDLETDFNVRVMCIGSPKTADAHKASLLKPPVDRSDMRSKYKCAGY